MYQIKFLVSPDIRDCSRTKRLSSPTLRMTTRKDDLQCTRYKNEVKKNLMHIFAKVVYKRQVIYAQKGTSILVKELLISIGGRELIAWNGGFEN